MTQEYLKEEFTEDELYIAFNAIHDSSVIEKLEIEESKLLAFIYDLSMQEALFEYFNNKI